MNCIINAANGYWYPRGQKRLVESLKAHGFTGKVLTWCNEPMNSTFNPKHPYTIKAAALVEAMNLGYKRILWLDCSVWVVKNPDPIFDIIERDGVFMWRSGYSLGQTASDKDLEFAGITRDEAMNMHECASNVVGLNLEMAQTRRLVTWFLEANKAGVCSTSRHHDNQSADPRFLFARQDQTAFTIAFHKAGYTHMYVQGEHTEYYSPDHNESVTFLIQGM